jgi:peptidyl-prolyl cis-trans isomerase B (cyclophilin B)
MRHNGLRTNAAFAARLPRLVAAFLATVFLMSGAAMAQTQKLPQVRIETTMGAIVLEINAARAPKTAENFLAYVKAGHYDGTIFHRVIPGFMIQGGGMDEKFKDKDSRQPVNNESKGGLPNDRGTVAMARTSQPHSATDQFFINVADNDFLNASAQHPGGFGYTVFGKVVSGLDVVDKIVGTPTGSGGPFPKDVPKTAVVIKSAKIVE